MGLWLARRSFWCNNGTEIFLQSESQSLSWEYILRKSGGPICQETVFLERGVTDPRGWATTVEHCHVQWGELNLCICSPLPLIVLFLFYLNIRSWKDKTLDTLLSILRALLLQSWTLISVTSASMKEEMQFLSPTLLVTWHTDDELCDGLARHHFFPVAIIALKASVSTYYYYFLDH